MVNDINKSKEEKRPWAMYENLQKIVNETVNEKHRQKHDIEQTVLKKDSYQRGR